MDRIDFIFKNISSPKLASAGNHSNSLSDPEKVGVQSASSSFQSSLMDANIEDASTRNGSFINSVSDFFHQKILDATDQSTDANIPNPLSATNLLPDAYHLTSNPLSIHSGNFDTLGNADIVSNATIASISAYQSSSSSNISIVNDTTKYVVNNMFASLSNQTTNILASDNFPLASNLLSSSADYDGSNLYFNASDAYNMSMNATGYESLEESNVFILPWYQQIIWSLLFGSMVLIAAGGNAIVIWIVLTHERMRTVTNYFIVNLSFADIMVSTLNVIFNFVYMLDGHWPFGDAYCKISNFISILSVAASVFTLMAISLDR